MPAHPNDGRALTDLEIQHIEENIYIGVYDDQELKRLFDTIKVQRNVLRRLFDRFQNEPFKLVSIAEPIRNSELAYLKELVSMDTILPKDD